MQLILQAKLKQVVYTFFQHCDSNKGLIFGGDTSIATKDLEMRQCVKV